jgi:hypothetical protein
MIEDEGRKIPGERGKRFHVTRVGLNGEHLSHEGEYDTLDELRAHKWRLDYQYKVYDGRMLMTDAEFIHLRRQSNEAVLRAALNLRRRSPRRTT